MLRERRPGERGPGNLERLARVAGARGWRRASRRSGSPRCATGSSRGSELEFCIEDARAGDRGGRRRARCSSSASRWAARSRSPRPTSPRVAARARPRTVDPRPARRLAALAASASTSCTGRSTAGSGRSPASSASLSRRGFERARALGVPGSYTLIPGGVHGLALRSPGRTARAAPARRDLGAARRGSARRVRRLNPAALRSARPSAPARSRRARLLEPRISHQERSTWKRCSPWRADAGKAWWLLCQPSPNTSIATTQLLRDSSRER